MKKKILFSIEAKHYFDFAEKYIIKLSKDFLVFVIIKDSFHSGNIKNNMEELKKNEYIFDYLITENQAFKYNFISIYFFINQILNQLKKSKFDEFEYYFTDSTALIFDKILKNFLNDKVITIINGYNALSYLSRNLNEQINYYNFFYDTSYYIEKKKPKKFIQRINKRPIDYFLFIKNKFIDYYKKVIFSYIYYIIPKLFSIKSIKPTNFEKVCLFDDTVEYLICYEYYLFTFYEKKLKKTKVFLAENLSKILCTCNNEKKNGALFLVSGFGNVSSIDDATLSNLYDNIICSLENLKTKHITLRHHPTPNYNRWVSSLYDKINKNRDIIVDIDYSKKPLLEVACKYKGVVGMPSLGLRDVILMCEGKTKAICFEELSKIRYPFPRGVLFEKEVFWLNSKNQISEASNSSITEKLNYYNLNDIFKLIAKD